MGRTCGYGSLNCISLFHFIKTHLIFDHRGIIDYDLNPMAYQQVDYSIIIWILMSCYEITVFVFPKLILLGMSAVENCYSNIYINYISFTFPIFGG